MAKTLLAAFPERTSADAVITELEANGYTAKDISVISKEESVVRHTDATGEPVTEGALSGATTGGVIGGVAGLLAGVGIIPGLAGLLIGGPIAVALGATGIAATTISGAVTGALAGGLLGALVNLGVPEETARYYDTTIKEGGIVLAVPVRDDESIGAKTIMENNGAKEIHEVDLKS